MKLKNAAFAMTLVGIASLAPAQAPELRCPDWALDPCGGPHHEQRDGRGPVRVWDANLAQWRVEHPRKVWDPNLAQWRVERPRQVWDPNLAQYRDESRDEVWDPYLARYRPRDARKDPPPPSRASEERSRRSVRRER